MRFRTVGLLLLVLVLVSLSLTVVAQEASVASILAAAKTAAQRYPHADAVYLSSDETVTIDSDGTIHDTVHDSVLLLDKQGIDNYGVRPVLRPYPGQVVKLDYARTIAPTGRETTLSDTALQQGSFPWYGYAPSEVAKAKPSIEYWVNMPGLQTGSVVDLQVTFTGQYPLLPGRFAEVWHLAAKIPTLESCYKVEVPRNAPFRWAVTGMNLAPKIQTGSNTVVYTFQCHNIPGIPNDEPMMPAVSALSPKVFVSTIESWDEFAGAYAREFDRSAQPDPNIVHKARELTATCTSDVLKISHIYQFVANYISYMSEPHLAPFSAAATLSAGHGDCKDQAALLIALLKAAGIPAYPALLNLNPGMDVDFSLPPTPGQFTHVIVAVPEAGGKWWFLDPSAGGYLAEYIPAQDTSKHVMVVLGEPDHLWVEAVTPASTPKASDTNIKVQMEVDKNGNILLHETSKITGDLASALIYVFYDTSNRNLQIAYQMLVNEAIPGARIVSFPFFYDYKERYQVPMNFNVTIEKDRAVDMTKDAFTIPVPYPPPLFALINFFSTLDLTHRKYPYFATPERIELLTYIQAPRGWNAVLPADVHVKNAIGSFSATYHDRASSASTVTTYSCDRVLQINVREVPPGKVALLKAIFAAVAQDKSAKITFHKEASSNR